MGIFVVAFGGFLMYVVIVMPFYSPDPDYFQVFGPYVLSRAHSFLAENGFVQSGKYYFPNNGKHPAVYAGIFPVK